VVVGLDGVVWWVGWVFGRAVVRVL
jgi:hypothetical protein